MSVSEDLVDDRVTPAVAPAGSAPLAPVAMAAAAVGLATLPILVAAGRGIGRHWAPTGDDAYSAVRAQDVFSRNVPLLGTWSSASLYTGHQVNHPGPLQFDLLALPVRLLGESAGTAAGIALVNAAAIAVLGWLVYRRLGPVMATVAMAASALLAWSLGSEILYDPWSQHAPMIPFALFLVATWMALAGDPVALPVAVVSGSYALQTHLSYVILVPAFTALAFGAVAWRVLAARRATGRADRRGLLWLAVGLGTALLCWMQPLVEQFTGQGEGNLAALWRSRDAQPHAVGHAVALRMLGGTVALPPAWLPPSFGSPSFRLDGHGRPTWLAVVGIGVVAVLLAVLGLRAWRRASTGVAAGAVVGLCAIALGYLTIMLAPMHYGSSPNYVRWMWPLGMVVWLVLAVALVDEAMARRPGVAPARAMAAALVVTAVAAVATGGPMVDNSSASPQWTVHASRMFSRDVIPRLHGQPVLVDLSIDPTAGAVGPSVFSALQDAGIPFYVDQPPLVRQLGTDRRFSPGVAHVGIVVRGGPLAAQHDPHDVAIASWSGLSRADRAELADLSGEVERTLVRRGLRLARGAPAYLTDHGADVLVRDVSRLAHNPDAAVRGTLVCQLWSGVWKQAAGRRLIDGRGFAPGLLDRWCTLADRAVWQKVTVYRHPV